MVGSAVVGEIDSVTVGSEVVVETVGLTVGQAVVRIVGPDVGGVVMPAAVGVYVDGVDWQQPV